MTHYLNITKIFDRCTKYSNYFLFCIPHSSRPLVTIILFENPPKSYLIRLYLCPLVTAAINRMSRIILSKRTSPCTENNKLAYFRRETPAFPTG